MDTGKLLDGGAIDKIIMNSQHKKSTLFAMTAGDLLGRMRSGEIGKGEKLPLNPDYAKSIGVSEVLVSYVKQMFGVLGLAEKIDHRNYISLVEPQPSGGKQDLKTGGKRHRPEALPPAMRGQGPCKPGTGQAVQLNPSMPRPLPPYLCTSYSRGGFMAENGKTPPGCGRAALRIAFVIAVALLAASCASPSPERENTCPGGGHPPVVTA